MNTSIPLPGTPALSQERKGTLLPFKTRLALIGIFFSVGFLIVAGRLAQLQIVRYAKYHRLATRDKAIEQMVPALRGSIYDRHGGLLAEDRPSYDLSVRADRLVLKSVNVADIVALPAKYRGRQGGVEDTESARAALRRQRDADFAVLTAHIGAEPFVRDLARALKRPEDEVAKGLVKALSCVARGWASARTPLRIVSGVDEKTWLGLRALHEDVFQDERLMFGAASQGPLATPPFPGLVCTVSTRRVYPQGSLACFVLGAVGELGLDEEDALRRDGVLLDNAAARVRYWERVRDNLGDEAAERAARLLRIDPREIESLGELYCRIASLRPQERTEIAALGLGDVARWCERPPRMQLNEPEMLWLGVGLPASVQRHSLPTRTIGELGVERYRNDLLRGKSGMKIRDSLDADDEQLHFRRNSQPREGEALALTLSGTWQRAVERALKSQDKPAAAVVLDLKHGDVLAMASVPDFDPNIFSPPRDGQARQEKLRAVLSDPRKPLLNRAIGEQYALGSIMKTLVAMAALERGVVTTTETIECAGHMVEGGQKFHCDEGRAHGTVSLGKGLRVSCNLYYQQIGARLGVEGLGPFAKLIFGHRTGLDLPGEVAGIYPDRAWRERAYPNNRAARTWTRGNDYLLSIGQGHFSATVLQAAVLMGSVGNGGYVVTPRLWLDAPVVPAKPLGVSPSTIAVVKQGLEEVANSGRPGERGTAYGAFHERGPELAVRVAGKTSTAEHRKGETAHAWFAGYAPADNPQVAFAVLVEEGGHGGGVAAPLVYAMLRDVYGTRAAPVLNPGAPEREPVAEVR
jgi:cell division protein FtsI/penicillin-binding protein 2